MDSNLIESYLHETSYLNGSRLYSHSTAPFLLQDRDLFLLILRIDFQQQLPKEIRILTILCGLPHLVLHFITRDRMSGVHEVHDDLGQVIETALNKIIVLLHTVNAGTEILDLLFREGFVSFDDAVDRLLILQAFTKELHERLADRHVERVVSRLHLRR